MPTSRPSDDPYESSDNLYDWLVEAGKRLAWEGQKMTVRQLIEKLEGIALIWDGDAEIRLACGDIGATYNNPKETNVREFQIQAITGYTPPGKEKPAIVDIEIRLWGRGG